MERQTNHQISIWKGLAAGFLGGVQAPGQWTRSRGSWAQIHKQRAKISAIDGTQEFKPIRSALAGRRPSDGEGCPSRVKACISSRTSRSRKKLCGNLAHHAMGAGSGAVYGAVAEVLPATTLGRGLLFGTVLWLIADEAVVPAPGLSKVRPNTRPQRTDLLGPRI